jgi:putative ABC transport system permease protein
MVVRQQAAVVGAGLAVGVVGSLLAGRLLAAVVHGVPAADPAALVLATAVLLSAAAAAAWLSTRRVLATDPAVPLRSP